MSDPPATSDDPSVSHQPIIRHPTRVGSPADWSGGSQDDDNVLLNADSAFVSRSENSRDLPTSPVPPFDSSPPSPLVPTDPPPQQLHSPVNGPLDPLMEAALAGFLQLGEPRPTRPRKAYSYSKKKLLAPSRVYSESGFPIPGIAGLLVGVIAECPNKNKNGGKFRVDWETYSTGMPDTVDRSLLRVWYPSTDYIRECFQIHADEYIAAGPAGVREALRLSFDQLAPANVPAQAAHASPDRELPAPPTIVLATPLRYAGRAALMTAADTVSTLTGNSGSQRLSTGGRSTRSNASQQGYESESVDGSDLDEDDNAWLTIPEEIEIDLLDDAEEPDANEEPEKPIIDVNLEWNFEMVNESTQMAPIPDLYDGPGGLRPGVAASFKDPLECLQKCGGLTVKFVGRLAKETNKYFNRVIAPTRNKNMYYCGIPWSDVSTGEMHRFLGVLLKISLQPRDGGGYESYFQSKDKELCTTTDGTGEKIVLTNTKGWAQKVMSLARFKQIRGAFHPMDKVAGMSGDKCYQLRNALNNLNTASRNTFIPGPNLAFDEGGVSCRSRLCPVRQYNKAKPQPYRVDFFILADSATYAILHMDVYQGKNETNAFIVDEAKKLPTTMKAVVNGVLQTKLDEQVEHGYRVVSMDNRYQCPVLAAFLRDRCHVLSTGTCKANRIGWPKDMLQMTLKGGDRGESIITYDKVNEVVCLQWRDNKVVNVCSSITDVTEHDTSRREGSRMRMLRVPRPLHHYHKTMGGVDKGDQMRMHGGGWARKGHYKKWYKKSFMGVLDCMLLNSLVAWNLSCNEIPGRTYMKRHDFYAYIAEKLMQFPDERKDNFETVPIEETVIMRTGAERCVVRPGNTWSRCLVCSLNYAYTGNNKSVRAGVCNCDSCGPCHMHVLPEGDTDSRPLHKLFGSNMSSRHPKNPTRPTNLEQRRRGQMASEDQPPCPGRLEGKMWIRTISRQGQEEKMSVNKFQPDNR